MKIIRKMILSFAITVYGFYLRIMRSRWERQNTICSEEVPTVTNVPTMKQRLEIKKAAAAKAEQVI